MSIPETENTSDEGTSRAASIKTELAQEDYDAFLKSVARSVSSANSGTVVTMCIASAIFLGITFALAISQWSSQATTLLAFIAGALGGAFLATAAISHLLSLQSRGMKPTKDGFMFGPQETSLETEGIRTGSAYHRSIFLWPVVQAIVVTDQHVFVMVDRISGIILPKRAFSSGAELEQFVAEIEARSGKIRS